MNQTALLDNKNWLNLSDVVRSKKVSRFLPIGLLPFYFLSFSFLLFLASLWFIFHCRHSHDNKNDCLNAMMLFVKSTVFFCSFLFGRYKMFLPTSEYIQEPTIRIIYFLDHFYWHSAIIVFSVKCKIWIKIWWMN